MVSRNRRYKNLDNKVQFYHYYLYHHYYCKHSFFRTLFKWVFFCFYLFNSRKAIAEAVIGLLFVLFIYLSSRFLLRPYDFTTTSNILFVQSFMQFKLNCARNVIFHAVDIFFCSFAWLKFWSHVTYLTLKNDFLTLKLTGLFFNSKR